MSARKADEADAKSGPAELKPGMPENAGMQIIRISKLRPSPENDSLYRPVRTDDQEIVKLAKSIAEFGMREPIVLTLDNFILSGHRRYAAAYVAGLHAVPVRYEDFTRIDDHDRFVRLLREYNRQREKNFAELLRETVLEVNPANAHLALTQYRQQKARAKCRPLVIEDAKSRSQITNAKGPMLEAVRKVVESLMDFWPLSVRQLHYLLLNDPPLRHASKPGSTYANDDKSYDDLTDLVTRARVFGKIPIEAVGDETRPVFNWNVHRSTRPFIESEIEGFLNCYSRDLMQSQAVHVEILAEKMTVSSILQPIAARFCIPLTIGRGYCSLPPRAEMFERFQKSGKERLVLLILSDFDPDGEEICSSFARLMRDDFNINNISAHKVAINQEQIKKFRLTPKMTAKESSTHHNKFVKKYGRHVFELEALSPERLQEALSDAIRSVIDIDLFNMELDAEHADAANLAAIRKVVLNSLKGVEF